MYVCLLLFIGSDCKIERVGITIALTFKQAFENQLSSEFEGLESPLLSAVSYFYIHIMIGTKFICLEAGLPGLYVFFFSKLCTCLAK